MKTVATVVEEGTQQTQHLTDTSTNDSLGCCWNHSTIIPTFLPNLNVTALQSSEAHGPHYHPMHSNNVEPLKDLHKAIKRNTYQYIHRGCHHVT